MAHATYESAALGRLKPFRLPLREGTFSAEMGQPMISADFINTWNEIRKRSVHVYAKAA